MVDKSALPINSENIGQHLPESEQITMMAIIVDTLKRH